MGWPGPAFVWEQAECSKGVALKASVKYILQQTNFNSGFDTQLPWSYLYYLLYPLPWQCTWRRPLKQRKGYLGSQFEGRVHPGEKGVATGAQDSSRVATGHRRQEADHDECCGSSQFLLFVQTSTRGMKPPLFRVGLLTSISPTENLPNRGLFPWCLNLTTAINHHDTP